MFFAPGQRSVSADNCIIAHLHHSVNRFILNKDCLSRLSLLLRSQASASVRAFPLTGGRWLAEGQTDEGEAEGLQKMIGRNKRDCLKMQSLQMILLSVYYIFTASLLWFISPGGE